MAVFRISGLSQMFRPIGVVSLVVGLLAGCGTSAPSSPPVAGETTRSPTPASPAVNPTPAVTAPSGAATTLPVPFQPVSVDAAAPRFVPILVPAAPMFAGLNPQGTPIPSPVFENNPPSVPGATASRVTLSWTSLTSLHDGDDYDRNNVFREEQADPLFRQAHRSVAAGMDRRQPIPLSRMDSFSEAIAEIKRRWLKSHPHQHGLEFEATQFDQMVEKSRNVGELVRGIKSAYSSRKSELIRLLGLFGENAAEAIPSIVQLVRPSKAGVPVEPVDWADCAQALANIGRPSASAMKSLLSEGTKDEQKFAIAVVGLLGERGDICVPELITLLKSPDPELVDAALWGLATVGPAAIDAVPKVAVLMEQDAALSTKGAGMLVSVGPPAVGETLKLVSAGGPVVKSLAVRVLGQIGKDHSQVVQALSQLLDDPQASQAAVAAFAGLGLSAKPAIPKLAAQLRGAQPVLAIKTLGALGETAAPAVPDLVLFATASTAQRQLQGHETPDAIINPRLAALDAIAKIGTADANSVSALAKLLQDPRIEGQYPEHLKAQMRGHVAKTLGELGPAGIPAVPQLIAVIETPILAITPVGGPKPQEVNGYQFRHTVIKKNSTSHNQFEASLKLVALLSLGEIGEKSPSVMGVCNKCLQDPDPAIRMAAVKSLAELGQPKDQLLTILKETVRQVAYNPNLAKPNNSGRPAPPAAIPYSPNNHQERFTLLLASQTATALGEPAIPALIEIVNSPDLKQEGLEAGMLALGQVGANSPEARLCLTRMSLERNSSISGPYYDRNDARLALASLGENPKEHVQALRQLMDEDAYTKSALEELAKSGADAASAAPKMLELLKSENVDIRVAAIKVLSAIGGEPEGVVPALLAALKDNDFRIHPEAFKGLCRMGPLVAPHAEVLVEYAMTKGGFDGLSGGPIMRVGTDAVLPVLLQKIEKNPAARQVLFMEFARPGKADAIRGEETVKLLAARLSDPNVEVRQLMAACLRNVGDAARPFVADLKKATRDKDSDVSWQATLALLDLLPFDEAIAAAPPAGNKDPLKGRLDQIQAELAASGQDYLNKVVALRQEASVGYWVRSLKNPDPRVRMLSARILPLNNKAMEAVLKSVVEDRKSSPEMKASAEQALEQMKQRREQLGE